MIPFDRDFAGRSAAAVHRRRARRASRRDPRQRGRELPLRQPRPGRRRRCWAPTGAFETRVAPLLEVDGEIVRSSHIRGLVAGGALEYAGTLPGDAVRRRRAGRPRRQARPHARVSRRPTSSRARAMRRRATGSTRAARGPPTGAGTRPRRMSGCARCSRPGSASSSRRTCSTSTATSTGSRCASSSCERLRGEKRFDSVDTLVEQMARDVEATRMVAGVS